MSSSNRLSKLSQYLNDGNYEQAIQLYNRKIQEPQTQDEYLLLAKAYFVGEHYSIVLDLLKRIQSPSSLKILFQSRILKVKSKYLYESVNKGDIEDLQWLLKKYQTSFNDYHIWCVNQIKSVVEKQVNTRKYNLVSKQILSDQKKEFIHIYNRYDDFSAIMEGMPVYLISQKWFEQWEQYVSCQGKVNGEHPGPITNFQILDHIYNGYFDERKQKWYTNNYMFQPCKYKIIPKQCWNFLFQRYGGTQVMRINISDINKPNEVLTEVYLKKIAIISKIRFKQLKSMKEFKQQCIYIQITKKQNWKGLIQNKLQLKWGSNGMIQQYNEQQFKNVNLSEFLEDCDTTDKMYVYVSNYKDQNPTPKNQQKCGNKECNSRSNLQNCQCKTIKYCSMECLEKDRVRHRKKCDLELSHIKQKSAIIENFNLSQKQYGGRKGLVGLKNLGNTCYMNSGLQCLSNTKQITDYFMSNGFFKHINSSNPLGTKGNLACAYAQLMREMWSGKDDVVSPFNLKKMIGKFATQFSGYGQQDSQQFISYLIDGLQQDLNLVKKKQTFQTKDEILPDEEASSQSQKNYGKRIQSYIRELMAGQFKSTVRCLVCKKISICFDPYLLVCLQIPAPRVYEIYIVGMDLMHGAIKLSFQITDSTTFKHLDAQIKRQYKNLKVLRYVKFDKQSFQLTRVIQNLNDTISLYHRQAQFLFAYEILEVSSQLDIYLTQYDFQKQRISFPRLLTFPKRNFEKYLEKVVQESYQRITKKSYGEIVGDAKIKQPSEPYNKICDKYLYITFKKKVGLLTYKENRDFQFSKSDSKNITLNDCLSSFSKTQLLEKENLWYCNKCKQFQPAEKQLQIYKSNKILVLAFKRFNRFKKIKTFIDFPIQEFDIGPFLKCNKQKKPVLYDLYGVVNHYGSLGGGHYTAYCQNFLNKRWYEFNDSRVSQISRRQIVSQNSYVLFFRKKN